MFQSTPARGQQLWNVQQNTLTIRVSIHARARATTAQPVVGKALILSFNPRPRAGNNGGGSGGSNREAGFNPRPRAGNNTSWTWLVRFYDGFQSTPARGQQLVKWLMQMRH